MYALTDYMSHYRGSPHFSHLDHPSSTPTTPSPPYPQYAQPLLSSMSQQAIPQSRQPTSYPSPHSYPSPSMSSYAYPPPQQQPQQQAQQQPQQNIETYRSSPTASHVSLPSLSLPPLRAIDPRNPTSVQAPMGSPIPAGGTPVANYYVAAAAAGQAQSLPPPGAHMNITSTPHAQGLRYPLPAPEGGRIMSGGRHKKEIKRRTKTGCLTCRKRRIKVCWQSSHLDETASLHMIRSSFNDIPRTIPPPISCLTCVIAYAILSLYLHSICSAG